MEILVGEQSRHFADEPIEEDVGAFLGRVHRFVAVGRHANQRVGPLAARQFRISDCPGRGVARDVELGNHADAALARVPDQLPNFRLRVVHAIGRKLLQFGKPQALHAKPLIVGEVPVQHVQFHCRHSVERPLHQAQWHEVPGHVERESAPREAGRISDSHGRQFKPALARLNQLEQRLQPAHRAERSLGVEPSLR